MKSLMRCERIQIEKRFPRWTLGFTGDKNDDDTDFMERFELKNPNLCPPYNPLKGSIFYSKRKAQDIYDLHNVLYLERGFIISTRLRELLSMHQLCDHVIFDEISCEIDGHLHNDYSFIYFYEDFSNAIDYDKSRFVVLHDNKSILTQSQIANIYRDDIAVTSNAEFIEKIQYFRNKMERRLHLLEICCPLAMKYDVFTIMDGPVASGVYISERLQKNLFDANLNGLRYAKNIYFSFACKDIRL